MPNDSAGRIRWGDDGRVFDVIVKNLDARGQVDELLKVLQHGWARQALIGLYQHNQIDLVESDTLATMTKGAGGAGPVNKRDLALTKFAQVTHDLARMDATDPRRSALLTRIETMRQTLAALSGGAR